MWAEDRASRHLGMRLLEIGPGRATLAMPVTAEMVNGHDIGHGGLTFALADSAFAFACNSHGPVTVAHSAEIRFLAPVHRGDELVANAVERTREGRRGVYDVQVRARDTLVATFVGRSSELRTDAEAAR
jgi:acyl-CoA thioesterase